MVICRSFSDAEKLELLSAAAVLIYTPENEHFGIVPIEAMAASRPVTTPACLCVSCLCACPACVRAACVCVLPTSVCPASVVCPAYLPLSCLCDLPVVCPACLSVSCLCGMSCVNEMNVC